tara:strand:+ start:382 stop:1491 length:1110 start_codon:yes stop_codon:yes gene_type:complete
LKILQRLALLFILTFPATSYSIRFLFETGISILGLGNIKNKHVFYSCLALTIILVLLHMPKLLLGYSTDSYSNIIRFSSVLIALFYFRVGFKEIFILLALLLVLNFSFSLILLLDLELGNVISGIFNDKNPELMHGRVAGIFHNIGVNSYFCYIACIYFFCSFSFGYRKKISAYLSMLAFISLVIAQSKTGIVLLLPSLILLHFYFQKISLTSISKILFISFIILSLFFYYIEAITSNFYFFTKLGSILVSGEASSLSARFDLWAAYLSLQIDSFSAMIFGLDKSSMATISNTFDNDLIWILVNFGVLGITIYFIMLMLLLRKNLDPFGNILKICCLFSIPFSFLIGVISQPQSALIFWMLFVNVRRPN